MLLVRCSRIWISDGHDGDCLCLLTFSYALGSSQHCELCSREWVEWLHVSRNVPAGSQRELPSKCRCTKKTPKEQLNPHYIFIPSLKGQLYMELFWIFASEKCDSADERLLVKRRAGGRQLTIVPDITFFTRHYCTDIAPTNTQWEQSKTMFLPTSSFICDEEKSFILWLSLNFAFVVANLFSKVVKLKYKAMASKFYKWVALKASLQGNAR